MTILPSFLSSPRRTPRKARSPNTRSFRCETLESRRLLAITINVGTHYLLPNTPNQTIEIHATSNNPAELISGLNLYAQLGDGNGGTPNPGFTAVDFTANTVWTNNTPAFTTTPDPLEKAVLKVSETDPTGGFISGGVIIGSSSSGAGGVHDIAPNGLIATVTVDTTGFFSGDFDLLLSSPVIGTTHFPVTGTSQVTPVITNGLIVVNTNPVADAVLSPATNYTVNFGGSVQLNGTESSDADTGDSIQSYQWDLNSGTFATADLTGATPTVSWSQLTGAGITTPGTYPITLRVTDLSGAEGFATVNLVVNPATVVRRATFYNGSNWDLNGAAVTTADFNATSTTKTGLRTGSSPNFINYTSYTNGLNGIMIAVDNIPNPSAIDPTDFEFRIGGRGGSDNNPANWTADSNTNPTTGLSSLIPVVTILENVTFSALGLAGEDVIALTWANNAIQNQWLEVTVLGNSDTGLGNGDRFYFGNLIGDMDGTFFVNSLDVTRVNTNQTAAVLPTVDNLYDVDRSRFVNSLDVTRVNINQTSTGFLSPTITLRGNPGPSAPEAGLTVPDTSSNDVEISYVEEMATTSSQAPLVSEGEGETEEPINYCIAVPSESSVTAESEPSSFNADDTDLIFAATDLSKSSVESDAQSSGTEPKTSADPSEAPELELHSDDELLYLAEINAKAVHESQARVEGSATDVINPLLLDAIVSDLDSI